MSHGVDGIVVSNHGESCLSTTSSLPADSRFAGGRQVEAAAPAIWALEKICAAPTIKAAQKSGKFTVLFDSGIRTGSDILKAVALGAQGVLGASL